jgi:lipooligosaccharide transport system ATP-binding protein
VLELRFAEDDHARTPRPCRGLAERVEVLPDRLLLYTDDGDAAVDQVAARGLEPLSVLVRRSSLEDVFLRLTGRSLID